MAWEKRKCETQHFGIDNLSNVCRVLLNAEFSFCCMQSRLPLNECRARSNLSAFISFHMASLRMWSGLTFLDGTTDPSHGCSWSQILSAWLRRCFQTSSTINSCCFALQRIQFWGVKASNGSLMTHTANSPGTPTSHSTSSLEDLGHAE